MSPMTFPQQAAVIALCVLATVATRFLPFLIFSGKRQTPAFVQYLGRALPGAIFAMLVVYCLRNTDVTAAFALPVLERLIYKPRQAPVTRVLVLVPTRELGIQVHSVIKQLAQFCSITTCLAVGECLAEGRLPPEG